MIMALARWLIRTVLGVLLFVLAVPALAAVSLVAMYCDRQVLD